jgi:hypothetical protein
VREGRQAIPWQSQCAVKQCWHGMPLSWEPGEPGCNCLSSPGVNFLVCSNRRTSECAGDWGEDVLRELRLWPACKKHDPRAC